MRRALLPLTMLVVCGTLASSASAGTWFTKQASIYTYIATNPDGFQIGTLAPGWTFIYELTPENTYGSWRYGYNWTENVMSDRCGWVNINNTYGGSYWKANPCGPGHYCLDFHKASRVFLRGLYAMAVNDYVPQKAGGGSGPNNVSPFWGVVNGVDTEKTTGTDTNLIAPTHLWGNYIYGGNPEVCTTPMMAPYAQIGTDPTRTRVLWRWVSDNRGVVLVLWPYNNTWGFVPRYCLPYNLPYSDGITRNDWQAGL